MIVRDIHFRHRSRSRSSRYGTTIRSIDVVHWYAVKSGSTIPLVTTEFSSDIQHTQHTQLRNRCDTIIWGLVSNTKYECIGICMVRDAGNAGCGRRSMYLLAIMIFTFSRCLSLGNHSIPIIRYSPFVQIDTNWRLHGDKLKNLISFALHCLVFQPRDDKTDTN